MSLADMPDIPKELDRRKGRADFVWSYTALNLYENICPYQFFRRYINKDIKFVESAASKWGNEVHSAFEYRIGGKPLPVSMQHWEPLVAPLDGRGVTPEMKVGITMEGRTTGYFSENVWGRCKIDAPIVANSKAMLIDWKSGNVREEPFELEVQAVFLHARYPTLTTIVGKYAWLKENRLGELHNCSDTRSTWNKICTINQKIEESRRTMQWEKRQSGLCGHCDVLDCNFNRKKS